jgi:uncharacterized protein
MTAQRPMVKIGQLEPTIKLASHNPRLTEKLMARVGTVEAFTFRAALVDEIDGTTRPNVIVYEGRLATPSPDAWTRDDKAGLGFTIKGVRYFRYEVGGERLHEIGLFPAKLIVNGVDHLAEINAALGR